MLLWLRLDNELAGGMAENGFHRPEALGTVLAWYREPVRAWFAEYAGYGGGWSEAKVEAQARHLLRHFSLGRADARAEAIPVTDD